MSDFRTIQTQVDAETYAWLKEVAREQNVGVGEIVRRALAGARVDDAAAAEGDEPAPPPVDVDAVIADRVAAAEKAGRLTVVSAAPVDEFEEPEQQVRTIGQRRLRKPIDWARRAG